MKTTARSKTTTKTKTKKKTKTAKKTPAAERAKAMPKKRADFGAPIDGFFGKQPAHLRAILVELRKLVERAVPDAESSIKWGMPFYTLNGKMLCALGAHKSHVNLILAGPPTAFDDPEGLLSGESKLGRHLKLTSSDDIPQSRVRGWLATASRLARGKR